MSTIVLRCDLTWTTTNAGGYTKTTLPASGPGGSQRTLDFPDPGLQALVDNFRREFADRVLSVDPNANAHVTITTATVT